MRYATSRAVNETISAAEKYGLFTEPLHDGGSYKLLISKKRCQVIRCRAVSTIKNGRKDTFIPLFVPKSTWAEFLILFVTPSAGAESEKFYILPRAKVSKRTMLPTTSSWLRQYANGWSSLLPTETAESKQGDLNLNQELEVVRPAR